MRLADLIVQLETIKKERGDLLVRAEFEYVPSFAIRPKGMEITIRFNDDSEKRRILIDLS